MRIGFGFDVHQLKENEELILGGIKIPHNKGIVAHSDGDVIIHALCDALLGAASLRDIGFHFPDTSKKYKNISGKILLQKTISLLIKNNYSVGNTDITVCLQKPKIKEYIPEMQKILAEILKVSVRDVSIKATTTEKLGYIGSENGISAYAVVLIK